MKWNPPVYPSAMVEALDPTTDEPSTITVPSDETIRSVIDNARTLEGTEAVVDDRTGDDRSLNYSRLLFADVVDADVVDGTIRLTAQEPTVFHRAGDTVDGWYYVEIRADADDHRLDSVVVRAHHHVEDRERPDRSALDAAGDPREKYRD